VTKRLAQVVLAGLLLTGCSPAEDPDAPWKPQELAILHSLSPLPALPPSPGNAVADDPRAVALGHALFFDKALSGNGQVACATCHVPEKYFTDGLARARGIGVADRNAPTLLGAPWLPYVFHDGRKDSLWAQALGPLENPAEHGTDRLAVAHHVAREHRPAFEALFGPLPALDDPQRFPEHGRPVPFGSHDPQQLAWDAMTPADRLAVDRVFSQVGKVLEAYERKLQPQAAPFDRYVQAVLAHDPAGEAAIDAPARRGLRQFIGKAQCVTCHNGPLLTDKGFHNLGLPPTVGRNGVDVGRSQGAQQVLADDFRCGQTFSDTKDCEELRFLDPRFEDFLGAFKTPSLRNVEHTAPYMHGGQFATLEAVVAFYKTLPGKAQVGHRELILHLLDPEVSTEDLVAFLHTLTGPLPDAHWLQPPADLHR
jgi:cytochrome c peroxidase